jgi:hypothetical protein
VSDAARNAAMKMVVAFSKAGDQLVSMSKADYGGWMEVAKKSSYKNFADKVKGGEELLQKALAVQ